jgi:small subunit ribosomal protein S16
MLVIRFQRTGRKNLASYRLVVAEKARAVKGKHLEILGHYLPQQDPPAFQFNQEKVEAWVKKGAIPSDTVARILKRNGVKGMEKYMLRYTKQRSKNAPAEEPAAAPAAAPAPAAEAPAASDNAA